MIPPQFWLTEEIMCVSLSDDTFAKLLQQLQSEKQRWNEFSSTEQNELAIIISATSVPNFQNQCKMLFTELDGASSNYGCVMKNAMANALYGLFTQPRDGRT